MNVASSAAVETPQTTGSSADWDTCPATVAQESLWFIDQLTPQTTVYHMIRAYRVHGPLDRTALTGALSYVVGRHEALRTTFTEVKGRAYQVIRPPAPISPRMMDLSGIPEADRFGAACRMAGAELDRPFDLSAGPLVRYVLITLAPDDHMLVLVMHHIISDGWSFDLFARELGAGYAALRAGRTPDLPLPGLQLGDVAAWEAEWLTTPAFGEHLAYWRSRLTDAPRMLAPEPDLPPADARTYRGANVRFRLAGEHVRALKALAQQERATLFMATLAGFVLLFGRYARTSDVVIGVPVAGRSQREFEDVMGYFVNTLAVRTDLSGEPTYRELVGRVRDAAVDAFAHQDVPLAKLVRELNPSREVTHNPLVQMLFQLVTGFGPGQSNADGVPELDGARVSIVDLANRFTGVNLEVQVIEADDGLAVSMTYATDLYERDTIERIGEQFVGLLAAAAADPDRRVTRFDVVTPAERPHTEGPGAFATAGLASLAHTRMRVVDADVQRVPAGVVGELCLAVPALGAASLARPSETALQFIPDPFASEPGARMYVTGELARCRDDGVVEVLGRPATPTAAPAVPTGDDEEFDERTRVLAAIWAELLEVDEVGIDDDFFVFGGYSILAIRAIIMIREAFGIDLPLRAIFDAPSVAKMSQLIANVPAMYGDSA